MISTVTKIYSREDNTQFYYLLVDENGTEYDVPHNPDNRHYQEILEWVAEGNTITDNGGGA